MAASDPTGTLLWIRTAADHNSNGRMLLKEEGLETFILLKLKLIILPPQPPEFCKYKDAPGHLTVGTVRKLETDLKP